MHLGSFLKVKVQNGGYFLGLLKFQIFFFGCLKFLIFLGMLNGRCWVRAYVCRKNESTPPPHPGNQDSHNISDKFKFWRDQTSVICH